MSSSKVKESRINKRERSESGVSCYLDTRGEVVPVLLLQLPALC